MGKQTEIAWTDSTFNPWIGCSKVSAGCANCYAETLMDKRMGRVQWGIGGTRSRTSEQYWQQPLRWNAEAERTGVPRSVFCGSLCDWLEDRVDCQHWRYDLFDLIEATQHLRWLMLTKRPEEAGRAIYAAGYTSMLEFFERNPHVWFGISVENQEQADKRIPLLLDIPARVRFLSMEPLLGPVDFRKVPRFNRVDLNLRGWWVIVGGESGPNARPMHPEWVRSIRRQCNAAGVPFFFKQWGEWELGDYVDLPSIWLDETTGSVVDRQSRQPEPPPFTSAAIMRKVGKRLAGRELDGREWSDFPVITHS